MLISLSLSVFSVSPLQNQTWGGLIRQDEQELRSHTVNKDERSFDDINHRIKARTV